MKYVLVITDYSTKESIATFHCFAITYSGVSALAADVLSPHLMTRRAVIISWRWKLSTLCDDFLSTEKNPGPLPQHGIFPEYFLNISTPRKTFSYYGIGQNFGNWIFPPFSTTFPKYFCTFEQIFQCAVRQSLHRAPLDGCNIKQKVLWFFTINRWNLTVW